MYILINKEHGYAHPKVYYSESKRNLQNEMKALMLDTARTTGQSLIISSIENFNFDIVDHDGGVVENKQWDISQDGGSVEHDHYYIIGDDRICNLDDLIKD